MLSASENVGISEFAPCVVCRQVFIPCCRDRGLMREVLSSSSLADPIGKLLFYKLNALDISKVDQLKLLKKSS